MLSIGVRNYCASHSPSFTEHSGEKCTAESKAVPAYKEMIVDGMPKGA